MPPDVTPIVVVVKDSSPVQTILAVTGLIIAVVSLFLSYRAFRRDSAHLEPRIQLATTMYGVLTIVRPPGLYAFLRHPWRSFGWFKEREKVLAALEHLQVVLIVLNDGRRTAQVAGVHFELKSGYKVLVRGGGDGFDHQAELREGDRFTYRVPAKEMKAELGATLAEMVAISCQDAAHQEYRRKLPELVKRAFRALGKPGS